jgi:2-polyprenyl-3-methyl-5-hydroxy-6-metoxy-1,4-benzoquinol methylase
MPDTPVRHETTYSRRYIGSIVHRARLNSFIQILRRHLGEDVGTWGDFGCSNGFIIESILKEGNLSVQSIVGLDHSRSLLEEAERKEIPGTVFEYYDLNGDPPSSMHFQLVACLEALEHIKDYRHGFKHLCHHLVEGGMLVITVPNETGVAGLIKYFGRYVARRDPYDDFFKDRSKLKYVWSVATGHDIERFRDSSRDGHGPHLGFDYRRLERHIDAEYVQPGLLVPIEKQTTTLGMNVILAYRKPARVEESGLTQGHPK